MSEFKDFKNGTKIFKDRMHERMSFSEDVSFSLIGSIDPSDCIRGLCIQCTVHDKTHNSIVLQTDYHLTPGTLIKMNNDEDPSINITGIVMWSLTHNNSCKAEILLL
jgi:hypothetical protein